MDEQKSLTATLSASVPKEIHTQVKMMAAMKGISVQRYIAQAVMIRLAEDQKAQ
jgi:predicted HicB family RNase H-like nuclease